MSIDDVINGLAARIRAGMPSTDALAGRTFAYGPGLINPPTAIVLPAPGDFLIPDDTMDGTQEYTLVVKVIVGAGDDRSGQGALLSYLDATGSTSIRAAIYGDVTLGGTCAFCRVTGVGSYGDVEWAAQTFYGADINVDVFT